MKKYLLLLITLIQLSSFGQTIDLDGSLKRKQGESYLFYDNELKHVKAKLMYVNDTLHGKSLFYNEHGDIQYVRFLDKGKLVLKKTLFTDGAKKRID